MPRRTGTVGLFPQDTPGPIIRDVEAASIAETLPELYRAVLARVATLEFTGHRHEALLIRRAAVAAYSRAWNERAEQRLTALQVRAERVLDGVDRPRASLAPGMSPRIAPRWSRSA
ncbi:MAG: hypothetical protein V4515_10655 [Chloroflexota bacterium]